MPAPDFSPGKRVFKPARTLYLAMTGLLALVRMPQAPQSTLTFFVTSTTAGRRALLPSDRMAELLVAPGLKSGADGESSKEAVSPVARNGRFILLLKYGKQVS